MPNLTSITISPTTPFIITQASYNTQQFTATAHYSDASDVDITTDLSTLWASSQTLVATISSSGGDKGLATAGSISGPTVISATYQSIVGTTILRVGLTRYSRIFEQVVEGIHRTENSMSAIHSPIAKLTSANLTMVSGAVVMQNVIGMDNGIPIGWTIASNHPGDYIKVYISEEQQQNGDWVQLNSSGHATNVLTGMQRSLGVVSSVSVDSNGTQLVSGGNPVFVQIAGEAYVSTTDTNIVRGSFLVPDTGHHGQVVATTFDPVNPTPIIGYSLETFASSTYPNKVLMRIQICGE